MKFALLVFVFDAIVAWVAATADGTATRIVLFGAATTVVFTGARRIWRDFLKPFAKLIKRTLAAVETFEHLPIWQREADERFSGIEGEQAIMMERQRRMANGQRALLRELGIDSKVRTFDPDDPAGPPPL